MKRILGLLLTMILITGLLAGCAGTSSENSGTSTPSMSNASTPESSNTEAAVWPRTITDAAGHSVTLEKQPQRISVLHSIYLEYFFALDMPPTASAGSTVGDAMKALNEWETLKPYANTLEIMDLGSASELNLEAILQSKPDVIVTFKGHSGLDDIYEQLEKIAPVIQLDNTKTWQEKTMACAEIIGKEKTAQKVIAETEAAIAAAKKIVAQNSDKTIAFFRISGGKSFSPLPLQNNNYYAVRKCFRNESRFYCFTGICRNLSAICQGYAGILGMAKLKSSTRRACFLL